MSERPLHYDRMCSSPPCIFLTERWELLALLLEIPLSIVVLLSLQRSLGQPSTPPSMCSCTATMAWPP